MIGYVTLGTNDLKRAAAFYDAIAASWSPSKPKIARRSIGFISLP
jgi:catechol 2,3-dioxygenase-like lactoylglutathione lyase family enzyme